MNREGTEYMDYWVSQDGNVVSYRRSVAIVLRPFSNSVDVQRLHLYLNGRRRNEKVHHLVARSWIGMPSSPELEVNHIDGDRRNNRVDNLEWVTAKENMEHAVRIGIFPPQHGEHNPSSKLTCDAVSSIRKMLESGKKQTEIAALFGVSQAAISLISCGHRWNREE